MILTFRPIKTWPDGWLRRTWQDREPSPFKASYADTLEVLDRELSHLNARECTLQVAAKETDCRLDGQLKANAKVDHPGVILTADTKAHGTLVYATDRFDTRWSSRPSWQENLRAVALGLEALRKVERYGIAERGQQYAGYRELGAGIPLGAAPAMTVEVAGQLLWAASILDHGIWPGLEAVDGFGDRRVTAARIRQAWRAAGANGAHPDAGGSTAVFDQLTRARDLLLAAVAP